MINNQANDDWDDIQNQFILLSPWKRRRDREKWENRDNSTIIQYMYGSEYIFLFLSLFLKLEWGT
jgi:hypothetical protein